MRFGLVAGGLLCCRSLPAADLHLNEVAAAKMAAMVEGVGIARRELERA